MILFDFLNFWFKIVFVQKPVPDGATIAGSIYV